MGFCVKTFSFTGSPELKKTTGLHSNGEIDMQ